MNTKSLAAAGIAAVLAVILAACGGGGSSASSSRTISPSESAAIATAKAAAQDYLAKCIPTDAAHQILLGKSLLTKDGRSKFAACLAIPPENRSAFEAAALAAAEKVKWTDKDQRRMFFTVTLPGLAAKYHVSATPSATPSGTVTVTVKPSATVTK